MSDHSKVDLILNNFYSKTLHLLLESRVSLPETKSRISKWVSSSIHYKHIAQTLYSSIYRLQTVGATYSSQS